MEDRGAVLEQLLGGTGAIFRLEILAPALELRLPKLGLHSDVVSEFGIPGTNEEHKILHNQTVIS